MTTNWKGGNGNWQTAAKWTAGAPTTPTSHAVINAPGAYTVTIGSGLEYHVGTVLLDDAGATLAIQGILDLAGKLTATKGTVLVTGEIQGGTIAQTTGLRLQGATLSDLDFDGPFNLDANASTITISDG